MSHMAAATILGKLSLTEAHGCTARSSALRVPSLFFFERGPLLFLTFDFDSNETDMGRNSIVPRNGSDYSWSLPNVYYNYEPRPPQTYERFHAKDKPHGICHVVDTTPFDGQRIRTSELKCIAILAFFRNAQPEYRHLDYFCVSAQC